MIYLEQKYTENLGFAYCVGVCADIGENLTAYGESYFALKEWLTQEYGPSGGKWLLQKGSFTFLLLNDLVLQRVKEVFPEIAMLQKLIHV